MPVLASPYLAARIAASVVAAALLFRALHEEREGADADTPSPRRTDLLRRGFFALLGGVVFFYPVSAHWTPGNPYRKAGKGFLSFYEGVPAFHFEHTHLGSMAGAGEESAARK